jgi:hypothetical protein
MGKPRITRPPKIKYNYSSLYYESVSVEAQLRRKRKEQYRKEVEEKIPSNYFTNPKEKQHVEN